MYMKKILLLFLVSYSISALNAQLVNDGATIVVQSGATLFVESDLINSASGVINNSGTIEVMGNFNNDATSTLGSGGLVKFTGSTPSLVTLNGDALTNVEINKTGTANVTLADAMTVNGALTLTMGDIILGANNLNLSSATNITGGSTGSHLNATGAGMVKKTFSPLGFYTFPVGDGINYTPLTSTPSGSTLGTVGVNLVNTAPTNLGTNPNYLTRFWNVTQTGITGYSNILLATYNEADDVVGTEALIKGAVQNGLSWSYTGSNGNAASNMVGSTTGASPAVFSGLTSLGTVQLQAFLQGPYTGGVGPDTMTTALNYKGYLQASAATSPYVDKDANGGTSSPSVGAGFFASHPLITDWIQIQLINPNLLTDTIKKSAFITKNGDIVDLDGTTTSIQILGAYEPSIVRLVHRNHLAVKTNTNVSTQVLTPINFKNNSNIYTIANFGNITINNNGLPQKQVETGVYALWAGDATSNGIVLYNGSGADRTKVLQKVGVTTPSLNVPGYFIEDLNLNGEVLYNGANADRTVILQNVGVTTPSNSVNQHN